METLSPARQELRKPQLIAQETKTADIYVVDQRDAKLLIFELDQAGFKVCQYRSSEKAKAALMQHTPLAAIVHAGPIDGRFEGFEMMTQLNRRITLTTPVFFTAANDKLETRLAAIRAGGAGFFPEPLDHRALIEKLKDRILADIGQSHNRLLIVNDTLEEARILGVILKSEGFMTRVVAEPLQLVEAAQSFRPDLVMLDLDLRGGLGLELTKVIRQYSVLHDLPVIVFADQDRLSEYLPQLEQESVDPMIKPINPEYLCWLVRQRLRQTYTVRQKLQVARQNDEICRIFNRQHFLLELERSMLAAQRDALPVAVMLILLENWRAVCEELSITSSDDVLGRVAQRLQKVLGPRRELSRFGDAIFAALFEKPDRETLMTAARAVKASVESCAFRLNDNMVRLRTCIGISIAENKHQDHLSLIQHADLACTLAREAGSERIHIYRSNADSKLQRSHVKDLLEQTKKALASNRIKLLFQPIISTRNDRRECYEVFLRLYDPSGRELLPDNVFGALKGHLLGASLDVWVIKECLRLLMEQSDEVDCTKTLFINLTQATLQDTDTQSWLRQQLEDARLQPGKLILEVTENTAWRHFEGLKRFIDNLRPLGCGFSLDHFGRRADSVRLAQQLGLNYVKLDSHLTEELRGVHNRVVKDKLREMREELRELGVIMVATGIEEIDLLPVLWSCGVECMQGFVVQGPHEEMDYNFVGAVSEF